MRLILITILSFTISLSFSQEINKKDANGLKQGKWVFYYDDAKTQIKKEGEYKDNKKTGIWKEYYVSGKVKSEITYIKNKPNGYAKFYYENGNVSEEGIWKGNKWVGDYKYYYKNGKPSYVWHYSENGKRTGEQKYYHENGKIMIEGNWQDGKEQGTIKEYDNTGKLISEKTFNDGKMDETSVKIYNTNSANNTTKTNNTETKNTNTETTNTTKKPKEVGYFDGNGFHTVYNKYKLVDREGEFKNGKLISGKRYYYNPDKTLKKTVIYKNGNIVNIIYPK